MDLTNSWMNDPTFLAQSSHFFGAFAVIMTATYFFGKKGAVTASIIFSLLMGIKEFWYDLIFELPKQTIGDSLLDYSFYIIGVISVLLMVFLIKPKIS